jgi:3',5'-cyclic AMP phosphodiesterase CpdA
MDLTQLGRATPFSLLLLVLAGCCSPRLVPVYSGDLSQRQGSTFILVGDTQRTSLWELWREQNDQARIAVLERIVSEGPAFVVHLGDVVFEGSSESHWRQFDAEAAGFRTRGIPVLPVLGNHDYYLRNARALRNFFSRFPQLGDQGWSAFRYRSVGILLLNSNFGDLSRQQREEQSAWYLRSLRDFQADPELKTILVACHAPPYCNGNIVSDNETVQQDFVPPFLSTPKAKLFFSGHCHSYEHFFIGGKHFVISGGGGGPRQSVEADLKRQRHPDLFPGGSLRPIHFCRVSILSEGLHVQMVCLSDDLTGWSVGDEFLVP